MRKGVEIFFAILSLLANPLAAFADTEEQFHNVCDASLAANNGDQLNGECTKAQMALTARNVERTETIIYGTAAATAYVLALTSWSPFNAATESAICTVLSISTGITAMFLDGKGATTNSDAVGKFNATANSFVPMIGSAVQGARFLFSKGASAAASSAGNTTSALTTAGSFHKVDGAATQTEGGNVANAGSNASTTTTETAAEKAEQANCLISAISLSVMGGFATSGMIAASNAFDKTTQSAANVKVGATGTTPFHNIVMPGGAPVPNNKIVAPNNQATPPKSCDVACASAADPTFAALTAAPGFMNKIGQVLGQDPNAFAKNFKGNTAQDAGNYIASGMGAPGLGGALGSMMDAQQKVASASGIQSEAYKPGVYTDASGGRGNKSNADPMAKMMADLMKQMAGGGADGLGKESRDPASEIAFRQLDLLPPDKITESKDISLFTRVQRRMQLNSKNLEQLNWSSDANQGK